LIPAATCNGKLGRGQKREAELMEVLLICERWQKAGCFNPASEGLSALKRAACTNRSVLAQEDILVCTPAGGTDIRRLDPQSR